MKRTLLYFILLILITACSKDDEPLKDIISVSAINDITVVHNVEFAALPFPDKVSVTYSDNTTAEINVTFSPGPYSKTERGTYALVGTLSLANGTTNKQNLTANVNVIVTSLLKTTSQDGTLLYEYFYDTQNRLDHFKAHLSNTEYYYTYSAENKVAQRLRKLGDKEYPEKYFYNNDGTLDRIEFYSATNVLDQTHTYTYTNSKISKYVNSDQTINGLKFKAFEYDEQGNVNKVSFDIGNPWTCTYVAGKNAATPLRQDLADPQNQTMRPVASFTFVLLSSYNATYTYNTLNYPTEEVRTFPGDNDKQSVYTYTYQ
jgi:hypothetical protein